MLTIRATCPMCEDIVDLQPPSVTLHLRSPTDPLPSRYGFACPSCTTFVVRPAGPQVIDLLLEGDVMLVTGALAPWEDRDQAPTVVLVESGRPSEAPIPDAPAFTEADAERFAELLEAGALEDWLTS